MNYSGSTKRNIVEKKEISTRPIEMNENKMDFNKLENESEINRVMKLFEKTREEDSELFHKTMLNLKKIIEIFSLEKCGKEDLKTLEELVNEIENINKDFLFWVLNKGIKLALIENKNLELVHFLFVKKNLKLTNKLIHRNILIQYFNSLSHINFVECDDENINIYISILEILIFYANVDINEKQDGIENTPLHIAVLNKNIPFIIALIKNKSCEINSKNKNGDTPLDFAISMYSDEEEKIFEEIIKLLVIHGAILNEENL